MLQVKPNWLISTSRVFENMQLVAERYSNFDRSFEDTGVITRSIARLLFRKKIEAIKQWKSDRIRYEVDFLPNLRDYMAAMGCSSTVDQINRILERKDQLGWDAFIEMQRALHDRVVDDLSHGDFFLVPRHRERYFQEAKILFGEDVNRSFPSGTVYSSVYSCEVVNRRR